MSEERGFTYYLLPGRKLPDDIPTLGPVGLLEEPEGEPLPWRRGLVWLAILGPFFFLSYGFANWWTASHGTPGSVVFGWEKHIPFVAWTIIPYWSIDLFYGLSFLLCRHRQEVDRHALRILSAQIVSVACFIAFPLRFTFERPATSGLSGWMFDVLAGFDQPFNQAPSLHISLLVILWLFYARRFTSPWRWIVHVWASLIALSVLTTYQHHFFDVPTGALAGAFCLWLWPSRQPSPLTQLRYTTAPARRRLATYYLLGCVACALLAGLGGAALWLIWPAIALGAVAFIYAFVGPEGFQKDGGSLSWGATLLLAPYLAGAWINSRLWTRKHPQPDEIADGVWLGRLPSQAEISQRRFAAVLDVSAELPMPAKVRHYVNMGWLDLVPPSRDQLTTAAYQIARLRRKGPVLVCCALGYSRSASAVAAWLLATGRAASVDDALDHIAASRSGVVLHEAHQRTLASLLLPTPGNA